MPLTTSIYASLASSSDEKWHPRNFSFTWGKMIKAHGAKSGEYTEKKMLLNQKHLFPKACIHWEKNAIWIKRIFFQKHVYHGFKSICYRISNILIGLVVYFYELIVCMRLERNAFESIAFFSQFAINS